MEEDSAAKAKLELAQIHLLRTRDVTAAHAVLVEILDDYPKSEVALEAHPLLARRYERALHDPARAIETRRARRVASSRWTERATAF